jgi:HK97 family phage major capsid protein
MLDPDGANLSNLVQRIPVSGDSGTWPALDQYVTPTAGVGDTAYAAGLTPAVAAEAAALGEDNITFEQLKWDIVKVGGVVDVSNELADDAPAVDTLLRQVFQIAIDGKLEHYILNGTGAGQPTGILPSACSIGVTTATNNIFAEADAMAMLARFKVVNRSRNAIAWVMHRGVIPDLAAFTASDRDMVEWRGGLSSTLLGYPILYSEHMPQDDNDDVLLADFSGYLLFDRQQLTVDFSEHAKFENDLGVWRYKIRVDGMPWLKSAITLADPQGSYTVSPFVYHDD